MKAAVVCANEDVRLPVSVVLISPVCSTTACISIRSYWAMSFQAM